MFHAQSSVEAERRARLVRRTPRRGIPPVPSRAPLRPGRLPDGQRSRPRTSCTRRWPGCPGCSSCTTWCCTTREPACSSTRRRCGPIAREPSSAAAARRGAAGPARLPGRGAPTPTRPRPIASTRLSSATVGNLLPYAYPLFRLPVEASRLVAAHNDFMVEAVRAEVPGAEVVRVPMMAQRVAVTPGEVAALRARLGIGPHDLVVGSFGLLTPEKQIETVARAVARAAAALPLLRLLLVGSGAGSGRPRRLLARLGVRERTVVTGRVPFGEPPGPHRGRRPGRPPALPDRPRDLGGAPAHPRPGPADDRVRPRAPGRHSGRGGRREPT